MGDHMAAPGFDRAVGLATGRRSVRACGQL